jgi:type VI secretion system protein ImpL
MSKNNTQPAGLYIGMAAALVFICLGIAVWTEGARYGWSRDTRIIIELCLLSMLLLAMLFVKYFEAALLLIASLKAVRWFTRYDSGKRPVAMAHSQQPDEGAQRDHATGLRDMLRDRHGWHWRYRDRWVLIAGDEPLVRRLAPDIASTGYAIIGDTVLLYAKQIGTTLDTHWLDQIRCMRCRRPVDAIVVVTRTLGSANAPAEADDLAHRLARHARALRWAAPAYMLYATDDGGETTGPDEAIGLTWSNARMDADQIGRSLQDLVNNLADQGVARVSKDHLDRYAATLSRHLSNLSTALPAAILKVARSRFHRHAVHGLLFAPLFKEREAAAPAANGEATRAAGEAATAAAARITYCDEPRPPRSIWQTVAEHSRKVHGRRIGLSLSTTSAWLTTVMIGLWITGTVVSGVTQRATIQASEDTLTKLERTQDRTQAALALNTLGQQIDTLEAHQREGAPWTTRFALNRDAALLAALRPAYENAARRIVAEPLRRKLEERLRRLASLSDAEIASGGDAQAQAAYDTLKTYLMLSKPELANAAFLTPQLIATDVPAHPQNSTLAAGAWDDLRRHLLAFYGTHLSDRSRGATTSTSPITADPMLVASTRQTIIGVRGIRNSTDAIYQQILDDARPKYPPVSLASLLGDAAQQAASGTATSRGLFGTAATIPGIFTRAAWDERIAQAIDDASEQHDVKADWVLSDTKATPPAPSTLNAELRQRYFDDYARAWGAFLNSLRWQPASTLSGTVDQLTLLGDAQRSPLVALMNVIVYQAGTGTATPSLSDTLIGKAKHLVGVDETSKGTSFAASNRLREAREPRAPLTAAFDPILRLTGSDLRSAPPADSNAAAQFTTTGDLSLARYLERVTAMRLKAQQMVASADPDAMSRLAAQAVLQGKTSDIAESRDYASRFAASLGEPWAGFGNLFEAPMDQTWQVVVQPAASSLNEIWRSAIVADWNRTFAGRYPFADSDNDASLPDMARFMRVDNGVIAQFVSTQLAGVVERQGDRWVAAQVANQVANQAATQAAHHGPNQGANHGALTLDPDFLAALNKLTRVSTVLFPSGDAQVRYELRAVPTPGITDTKFVLSGRELHYFNQKEEWVPFEWPGQSLENRSHIEWQTEQGGLRSALDTQGRFGLIRLLERANVSQQDSARYLLSWTPDSSLGIALRVQLRSEAGAGPLDALALRHFTLPSRIFVTNPTRIATKTPSNPTTARPANLAAISPPPLPPEAILAARRGTTPLPGGLVPGAR